MLDLESDETEPISAGSYVGQPSRLSAQPLSSSTLSRSMLLLDPYFADQIHRLAHIDLNLFIRGEPATGKSTAARLIHQQGMRCDLPFVPLLCSTLPRESVSEAIFGRVESGSGTVMCFGAAERANGGTLFIDEVGNLPLDCQARLLDSLENGFFQRLGSDERLPINFRLIVASDSDVWELCDAGYLYKDLFLALNECGFDLPPLRERLARMPEIVAAFLERFSTTRPYTEISDEALQVLMQHTWPGNLRELEFVLEKALEASNGQVLEVDDLPQLITKQTSASKSSTSESSFAGLTLAELEKRAIEDTLRACNGNKAKSARMLGISEKSIYNKMRRLEIHSNSDTI